MKANQDSTRNSNYTYSVIFFSPGVLKDCIINTNKSSRSRYGK
jgi:hypothetical protein